MANELPNQFNLTAETLSTLDNNASSQNLKVVISQHQRNHSYDSVKTAGGSPSRKSIAMHEKADINDFTRGISELKVAYVPSFGHNTLNFGERKSAWLELSQNILNSFAPKHSALLEFVHRAQQKEQQNHLNSYDSRKNSGKPQNKVSFHEPEVIKPSLVRQKSINHF